MEYKGGIMGVIVPTGIVSHWSNMVQGLTCSSKEFYDSIEQGLGVHKLQDIKIERVNLSEGGILSAKREYLQIRRDTLVFHVCAAPFGNGFFVSSWLGEIEKGFWAFLSRIPVLGYFIRSTLKPLTYYKADTEGMFRSVTHAAVLQALDAVVNRQGLRAPSEAERKPEMRDFFGRF